MPAPDRRKFLGLATCAVGGGVGAIVAAPVIRFLVDPATKQTVTTPREPIDLGPETRFGLEPTKVEIVAPVIRDAWAAARDVVLGAAFIRRVPATEIEAKGKRDGYVEIGTRGRESLDARSAVCPHLGCAVAFDRAAKNYLCPCHDSRFEITGAKMGGPSERGLDLLPLQIVNGRVLLTWERYRTGQSKREPV